MITEKEKLMAENSKATRIISELWEDIQNGVPLQVQRKHKQKIQLLQDVIFYNNERLEYLTYGVDN